MCAEMTSKVGVAHKISRARCILKHPPPGSAPAKGNGLSPVLLTVNALSPPRPRTRFARPRFALSRSDWAIHFPTQTPVGWFHARSLHLIRTIGSEYLSHAHSTVVLACRASGSRYALGPYNTVDPFPMLLTPHYMYTLLLHTLNRLRAHFHLMPLFEYAALFFLKH